MVDQSCEFMVFASTEGAILSSAQGVTEASFDFEISDPNFELFVTGFACNDVLEVSVFVELELWGQPGALVESR